MTGHDQAHIGQCPEKGCPLWTPHSHDGVGVDPPPRYGGIDEPYPADWPELPPSHPDDGGRFAMDADLTVYWPTVRPEWQESRA